LIHEINQIKRIDYRRKTLISSFFFQFSYISYWYNKNSITSSRTIYKINIKRKYLLWNVSYFFKNYKRRRIPKSL